LECLGCNSKLEAKKFNRTFTHKLW